MLAYVTPPRISFDIALAGTESGYMWAHVWWRTPFPTANYQGKLELLEKPFAFYQFYAGAPIRYNMNFFYRYD